MPSTPKPVAGALDLANARWQRAPGSPAGGQAVEIARAGGYIAMRASAHGQPLIFTPDEWAAFVAGVKDGEFDFNASTTPLAAHPALPLSPAPGIPLAANGRGQPAWLAQQKEQDYGC